jgi:hypothetical protein
MFILRHREACHVLTDGAVVNPDGRVAAILSKTMPLPHLGVAVALRGSMEMMTQLPLFGVAPDLATLRSRVEGAVRAVDAQVEVFVAGLDGGCFAVTADGVSDVDGWALIPFNNAIDSELGFLRSRTPDDIDPEVDGRRIMRVLRRHPVKYSNSVGGVGGFIQLTTVVRSGIITRIVHRWPDVVGQII